MRERYAKGNNAKRIRKWEPPQHSYLLKKGTERKMKFKVGDKVKIKSYEDLRRCGNLLLYVLDYDGSAKVISEVKEDGYVLSGYEGVIFPEITLDAVIENKEGFKYIANVYDKDSYLKIEFGFNLFEELLDFAETCIDHGKYVEVYKPNND